MSIRKAVIPSLAALLLLAACGTATTAHRAHRTSAPPAAPVAVPSPVPAVTTAPPPPSCYQRAQDWAGTPGAQAVGTAQTAMESVSSDASAGDPASVATDLQQFAVIASIMRSYPPPHCADPHHYWRKMTRALADAAAQSAGVGNGDVASVRRVTVDMERVTAYAQALTAELKGLQP